MIKILITILLLICPTLVIAQITPFINDRINLNNDRIKDDNIEINQYQNNLNAIQNSIDSVSADLQNAQSEIISLTAELPEAQIIDAQTAQQQVKGN